MAMAQPCQILLMRHATVDAQWQGKFLGAGDPPLSDDGLAQARWWQGELASLPLHRIICSDQKRAQQTAQIIAEGQCIPVEALSALREVDLGLWEGLSSAQVRQRYPEEYEQRGRDLAGFPPPGGESLAEMSARVLPVWRDLYASEARRILVVAHAGVLRVILCDVMGIDLNRALSWRLDHASLSLLQYSDARFTLLACNLPPFQTSLAEHYLGPSASGGIAS
jgi:broad specificity phosphatase PhoE